MGDLFWLVSRFHSQQRKQTIMKKTLLHFGLAIAFALTVPPDTVSAQSSGNTWGLSGQHLDGVWKVFRKDKNGDRSLGDFAFRYGGTRIDQVHFATGFEESFAKLKIVEHKGVLRLQPESSTLTDGEVVTPAHPDFGELHTSTYRMVRKHVPNGVSSVLGTWTHNTKESLPSFLTFTRSKDNSRVAICAPTGSFPSSYSEGQWKYLEYIDPEHEWTSRDTLMDGTKPVTDQKSPDCNLGCYRWLGKDWTLSAANMLPLERPDPLKEGHRLVAKNNELVFSLEAAGDTLPLRPGRHLSIQVGDWRRGRNSEHELVMHGFAHNAVFDRAVAAAYSTDRSGHAKPEALELLRPTGVNIVPMAVNQQLKNRSVTLGNTYNWEPAKYWSPPRPSENQYTFLNNAVLTEGSSANAELKRRAGCVFGKGNPSAGITLQPRSSFPSFKLDVEATWNAAGSEVESITINVGTEIYDSPVSGYTASKTLKFSDWSIRDTRCTSIIRLFGPSHPRVTIGSNGKRRIGPAMEVNMVAVWWRFPRRELLQISLWGSDSIDPVSHSQEIKDSFTDDVLGYSGGRRDYNFRKKYWSN